MPSLNPFASAWTPPGIAKVAATDVPSSGFKEIALSTPLQMVTPVATSRPLSRAPSAASPISLLSLSLAATPPPDSKDQTARLEGVDSESVRSL